MFNIGGKKKDFRSVAEWILEKWEYAHSGEFKWDVAYNGTTVSYERREYAMSFHEEQLKIGYREVMRQKNIEYEMVKNLFYELNFDLARIKRIEAIDQLTTEVPDIWGKPELKLGVKLIPNYAQKAIQKRVNGSITTQICGTEHEPKTEHFERNDLLNMGIIFLGNDENLHTRGKKAFEDLVIICTKNKNSRELF